MNQSRLFESETEEAQALREIAECAQSAADIVYAETTISELADRVIGHFKGLSIQALSGDDGPLLETVVELVTRYGIWHHEEVFRIWVALQCPNRLMLHRHERMVLYDRLEEYWPFCWAERVPGGGYTYLDGIVLLAIEVVSLVERRTDPRTVAQRV